MKLKLPKILFKSEHKYDQITINHTKSTRAIDQDLETIFKQNWIEITQNAKKQDMQIWDSILYRLEKFEIKQKLIMEFSEINFSTTKSANKYIDILIQKGEKYFIKSIFSSIIIKTADNKFILGKKSRKYMHNVDLTFIGGVLSKDEHLIENGKDLFQSALNEVQEELNIKCPIDNLTLLGGILTELGKCSLVFYLFVSMNSGEIKKNFAYRNDEELEDILILSEEDFKDHIANMDNSKQLILELLK